MRHGTTIQPATTRGAIRTLDSDRRARLAGNNPTTTSRSVSLRLRNRASSARTVSSPNRSKYSQLWLLAQRAVRSAISTSVDNTRPSTGRQRSALPTVAPDQEALLQPRSTQLPLVRRTGNRRMGTLAAGRRFLHSLHRGKARSETFTKVLARSYRQQRRLRTRQSTLGRSVRASAQLRTVPATASFLNRGC
jgi:hypothetical protein